MTQEEKQLLLADLCGRLPYGVMIQYYTDYDWKPVEMYEISCDTFNCTYSLELCKPYLRPMSSMTEEECDEIEEILGDKCIFDFMRNGDVILHKGDFTQKTLSNLYEFYNSHHFDYNGLIEKGLAIEALEGMYK